MKVAPIPAAQNPARSPASDAARRRSAVATVGVGTTAGPFLALPGGASPRLRRGSLERAYDDFVSTGAMDPSLRPVVADSWRLSRASGVSPHSVLPTVDLLDADLESYRSAHPLAAVMPLIRQLLTDETEGSNAIVVVADADARLLWVEGDRALRRHAEAMNWVAGSRWDEASTGTNAPAAAMRLNHALQVFAREHYASNVAAWSCTAAPIHDPISGRVLGALDITGRDDVAAPVVLGLVRAAVAAVESELRINAFDRCTAPPGTSVRPPAPLSAPACWPCRCWVAIGRSCVGRAVGRRSNCRSGIRSCCSCFSSGRPVTPQTSWRSPCTSGMFRR